MRNLDTILNTEVKASNVVPSSKHGMTKERIRFNTDVMFSVAKQMKMPLDKTAELMQEKNAFKQLANSYSQRHNTSDNKIAKEISVTLQEL